MFKSINDKDYFKMIGKKTDLRGKSDAKEASFIPLKDIKGLKLAFDHFKIIKDSGILDED